MRGLNWRSELVTPPDALPVSVEFIRDRVLRVTNGTIEDDEIEMWLRTAVLDGERQTGRAFMSQRRKAISDGFPPYGPIKLTPPLIQVVSLEYVDGNGDTQELAVSPAEFQIVPSGRVTKAELHPLFGQTWPVTRCQPDAVTVTYDCGYERADDVPETLKTGIGLVVGELYKQRTLSMIGTSIVEAPIKTSRFWPTVF